MKTFEQATQSAPKRDSLYQRRKAAGKCVRCGGERENTARVRCAKCMKYMSDLARRKWPLLSKEGITDEPGAFLMEEWEYRQWRARVRDKEAAGKLVKKHYKQLD